MTEEEWRKDIADTTHGMSEASFAEALRKLTECNQEIRELIETKLPEALKIGDHEQLRVLGDRLGLVADTAEYACDRIANRGVIFNRS